MRKHAFVFTFLILWSCNKISTDEPCFPYPHIWAQYSSNDTMIQGQDTIARHYYDVYAQRVGIPQSDCTSCEFIIVDSLTRATWEYFPYVGGDRVKFENEENDTLYFKSIKGPTIGGIFKFHPTTDYMWTSNEGAIYRRN